MSEVPVTAEWALWGKESYDTEYHLLECSDGDVGSGVFTEAITRYSPGTLERLPQVTVNWLRLHNQRDYVAMAIHDSGHGLHDAGGRKIVFTSYFCLPYRQLAAGAVSYEAMYAKFARFRLKAGQRSVIETTLPEFSGPRHSPSRTLAMRVAGLLLTSRPVCILHADRTGLDERLRFLDSVMALLPYGMRSELSASTWASSTAADHKLRLFFTSARRPGDDHVVIWDEPTHGLIGHRYADDYLDWLASCEPWPEAELAAQIEPVGFKQRDIAMMLERLHVSYDTTIAPVALAPPPTPDIVPRQAPEVVPSTEVVPYGFADGAIAVPERDMSVEQILLSCARRLDGGDPVILGPDMNRLRAILVFPVPYEDRPRYQQIIMKTGLLSARRPIPKKVQTEFYRLLVRLAFQTPLTYQDYRVLERCAGQPWNRPLLAALGPQPSDLRVRLLLLKACGDRRLRHAVRDLRLPPTGMIEAVASRELDEDHARTLWEIVIVDLQDRSKDLDRIALRQALGRHGYLATANRLYPRQPEYQRNQLGAAAARLWRHTWQASRAGDSR